MRIYNHITNVRKIRNQSRNTNTLLIIQYDPLGFDAAGKSYAEGLFYRIVSSSEFLTNNLYRGDHSAEYGQKNMAVVLIQDEDLKNMRLTWPVSLSVHAKVLNQIVNYKPLAIFIDISFIDQRNESGVSDLATAIKKAAEQKIPVYFASLEPFDANRAILPELKAAGAIPLPAFRQDAGFDGVERFYLLHHTPKDDRSTEPSMDSPALALYREYLSHKRLPIDIDKFNEPMSVFWAYNKQHPINHDMNIICNEANLSKFFSSDIFNLFNGGSLPSMRHDCPHAATIPVSELRKSSKYEVSEEAISGKFVFYGAHIKGSGDEIVAPIHNDRIPGVFLHAMAFDNLLVFGEGYKRLADYAEWIILAILTLAIFAVQCLRESFFGKSESDQDNSPFPYFPNIKNQYKKFFILAIPLHIALATIGDLKRPLANLMIITPVVIFICWFVYFFSNAAPINWVKYLGFALSVEFLEFHLEKTGHVKNAIEWYKSIKRE